MLTNTPRSDMFWLDGNAKVIIKQTYYKLKWKEFFTGSLLVVICSKSEGDGLKKARVS